MAEPHEIELRVSIAHHEGDEPGISVICQHCSREIVLVTTPTGLVTLNLVAKTSQHACSKKRGIR